MRILIDSTQIPIARTGVGIYAEQIIKELASILQPEDTLFVLVQDDDISLRQLIALQPHVKVILIRSGIFRNRIALGIYEQCILPLVLLRHRIDLVHSLHYTFPLISPCCRIVTIHDMTFFLWPQMHTWMRRIIMPFFIKKALQRAEGVLFVSNSTREDAERMFNRGNNLRYVAPHGVDNGYFSEISTSVIENTLSRYSIQRPYILFLGTLEPRKNIIRIVQAFELIAERFPQHLLVLAGRLGWDTEATLQTINQSPSKARIHRLGYVSAEDKFPLISGCDLLIYPSLYEGFGLPVLEGMAAAVPVVASNTSSIPEVTGRAAVLVDPSSTEQIAKAVESVLSDRDYSNWLRREGREQARNFSWSKTAELTYSAYRSTSARVIPVVRS